MIDNQRSDSVSRRNNRNQTDDSLDAEKLVKYLPACQCLDRAHSSVVLWTLTHIRELLRPAQTSGRLL